jgi:hypothetical protein
VNPVSLKWLLNRGASPNATNPKDSAPNTDRPIDYDFAIPNFGLFLKGQSESN